MEFLSIDVETGGLTTEHTLLEIGLVKAHLQPDDDDWLDSARSARIVLMHDTLAINIYCCNMHKTLLAEMHEVEQSEWWKKTVGGGYTYAKVAPDQPESMSDFVTYYTFADYAKQGFCAALDDLGIEWRHKPITAAGKNAGTFDLPFLAAQGCLSPDADTISLDGPPEPPVIFRRRILDPCTLYTLPDDTEPPGLADCLKRAGLPEMVMHTAIEDAVQVVRLLRRKLAVPSGPGFADVFPDKTT